MASAESRVKTSSSCLARPMATVRSRPTSVERRVGGGELALAAVDHDQVRHRPAALDDRSIAPAHDLAHRLEVVEDPGGRGRVPGRRLGARLRGDAIGQRRVLARPDPELAVFARLHPAVLADHHRGHRLAALERRDVEAVDAPRRGRQLQHEAQRLERVAGAGRRLAAPRLVGHPGVARRQLQQAALVAAARDDDPHPAARPRRQPVLDGRGVLERLRHVDLGRRHVDGVELRQRRGDDLALARRRRRPHPVDAAGHRHAFAPQLDAIDDAAAAHLEHHDRRAPRPEADAEPVAIAEPRGGHLLLPIAQRLDGADGVAPVGRLLVALRRGGGLHPAIEVGDEHVALPFEQQARAGHRRGVGVFTAERGDAGRDAALDVVLEARAAPLAGDHLVARPQAEQAMRQIDGAPGQPGWQERAEVGVLVLLDPPRHEQARERLAGRQLQVGVALVVPQQDVVFRRPLLDQVALERERLGHAVRDDEGERLDLVEQRVGLRVGAPRAEVVPDAVAEHPGLADVDGLAGGVGVEVDPGLLG